MTWLEMWSEHPLWSLMTLAGGYSLGYGTWALFHRVPLNRAIADGTIPHGAPWPLLLFLLGGILAICTGWAYRSYRRMAGGEQPSRAWLEEAHLFSLLNLSLPIMYLYWQLRQAHPLVDAWAPAVLLSLIVALISSRYLPPLLGHPALHSLLHPTSVTLTASFLFLVGTGSLSILRHRSFHSNALDMAMMDQLLWNTLEGRFLEGTLIDPRPTSFLGHHFSPALALMAPFYWLAPRPETLLIIQAAVIALSALILYRLAARSCGDNRVAATLALALLLNPFLHTGVLFDFHQDVLGMLFYSLALLGVVYRWRGMAAAGWLLSLLCKEELAIYWVAFALFQAYRNRERRVAALLFALLNIALLALILFILIPAFQLEPHGSFQLFSRYSEFGDSPVHLLVNLLTNPLFLLRSLLIPARIWGLLVITLPFLPFLLLGRGKSVILLFPLGINLLSSLILQHSFMLHYSFLPLILIGTAAAFGAEKGDEKGNFLLPPARLIPFTLTASLALFAFLSPLGLLRGPETLAAYRVDEHDRIGHRMIELIPPSAAVISQNTLTPHLAQREHVTLFSRTLAREVDFFVFDVRGDPYPFPPERYREEVARLIEDPAFGPLFVEDGYILLQRGGPRDRVEEALEMLKRDGP